VLLLSHIHTHPQANIIPEQSSTASTTADKVSQTTHSGQQAADEKTGESGESQFGFPSLATSSDQGSTKQSLFSSFTEKDDNHLVHLMSAAKEDFGEWYEKEGSEK